MGTPGFLIAYDRNICYCCSSPEKSMLAKVTSEKARKALFVVPRGTIDALPEIHARVLAAPTEVQSALNLVLFYLFKSDGPTNLKNAQYRIAEPYLKDYEIVLARYLKSRTNGNGRRQYGKAGLIALRKSEYRCEVCKEDDVRLLVLDHANGREDTEAFFVFCANCHQMKSRLFDWTGKKRVKRELGPAMAPPPVTAGPTTVRS